MCRDVENRSVPQDELKGATITLSNFGTMARDDMRHQLLCHRWSVFWETGVIREEAVVVDGKVECTPDHAAFAQL